jgi:tetratricopeptide (TPR) repeat protein
VKQAVRDVLVGLRAGSGKDDGKKLDEAIRALERSVDGARWRDDAHPQADAGPKVFEDEKTAVAKLGELLPDGHGAIDPALLQELIARIVGADRALAVVAIADAEGGDAKTLAQALDELRKGDRDATKGAEESAIDHYRNAWALAQRTAALPPDQPPRPTKRAVVDQLMALRATLGDPHDRDRLDKVIDALARSLTDDRWLDDSHLRERDGEKVFDAEREAVRALAEILKGKRNAVGDDVVEGFARLLLGADRALVVIAIAESGDGNPKQLDDAMDRLEAGDRAATLRDYDKAIESYREAWKAAQRA